LTWNVLGLMTSLRWLLVLVLALAPSSSLSAQPARVIFPTESPQLRNRLLSLDRKSAPLQTPEAVADTLVRAYPASLNIVAGLLARAQSADTWEGLVDGYYRLARDADDALVALPASQPIWTGVRGSSQLRRLVQRRLATLPRTVLETYRRRVDLEAQRLLDAGRRSRSAEPLRRLLDDYFCSRQGEKALDLLGDLAFEQGHFAEALSWWRQLVPSARVDADALVYPGPRVDRACVQAKQVLALALAGRSEQAHRELERLQREHPDATGHLAGRDGNYAATLREALEKLGGAEDHWPTFAGADSRNSRVPHCPAPALWEDGPTWRVPLPPRGRMAYHPALGAGQVVVAGPASVVSYDLFTGKELFRYGEKDGGLDEEPTGLPHRSRGPHYSLTIAGRRAYARLGQQTLAPKRQEAGGSYLVCLDLADGAPPRARELWRIQAQSEDGQSAFFEGAPLVRDERVYIAVSRLVGTRHQTAIACYDAHGKRRWWRDVCDCPEFDTETSPRYQQHLLTWAGNQLVYCSHAGAIGALDPWTGQPLWGVRYPQRGLSRGEEIPTIREPAPCLYVDGLLLVAPLDADRLFCLEATTGRVRWEQESVEVVDLIGAAEERVFFTTPRGLQAVALATGQTAWQQPAEGRLPSRGRGLIAGDWLFWPTQDPKLPVRAVNLAEGQPHAGPPSLSVASELLEPTRLRQIPAGNLAFAQGCLVVAGTAELTVFIPPAPLAPSPDGLHLNRLEPDSRYRLAHSDLRPPPR
jgi:outer membrane protein assembly factor BamB